MVTLQQSWAFWTQKEKRTWGLDQAGRFTHIADHGRWWIEREIHELAPENSWRQGKRVGRDSWGGKPQRYIIIPKRLHSNDEGLIRKVLKSQQNLGSRIKEQ